MRKITFGAEGGRAVLANQSTFEKVRAVARATAPVAVGHDLAGEVDGGDLHDDGGEDHRGPLGSH